MKFILKDYQSEAVRDSLNNLEKARRRWQQEQDNHAFSLTAITGAGKTVMAAATFESMFYGNDEYDFDPDPSAVVIWFSDDPSLNEQTRFRIIEASDKINHTDLVVIENTFNQPRFEAGKIYFLNTQKLNKKSLLVRGFDQEERERQAGGLLPETRPDLRAYTIWDTIKNTVEDPDLTLYLVLDEAHRGMKEDKVSEIKERSTIVQRLINGQSGVPAIPIVWGISATVERFNIAMATAKNRSQLPNVQVDPKKVQESGLIKDTLVIDSPLQTEDVTSVLLRRATTKLKESTQLWKEYANQQNDSELVQPLMVFQVPNTPDHDEIGRQIELIYETWPELPKGSFAHVFGEHTTQTFGGFSVPYISPERVQDSGGIKVLIAKDAISTGWDCPRAEVMISFRSATDKTHITQLLGRMIRAPLARRIPGNDILNSVICILPKFNRKAVQEVVDLINEGKEGSASPGRVLINPVETKPNKTIPTSVWECFESLPSQSRPQKHAKPIKRLTALAHELASDKILLQASHMAHIKLHEAIDQFLIDNKEKIEERKKSVNQVDGLTLTSNLKTKQIAVNHFSEESDEIVIQELYLRASKILSPAIAKSYIEHLAVNAKSDDEEYLEALIAAKVTVASLCLVSEIQDYLDQISNQIVNDWVKLYQSKIDHLSDERKETYFQILQMSNEPQDFHLEKPTLQLEMQVIKEGEQERSIPSYSKHLLSDDDGRFPCQLNEWEQKVLSIEVKKPGFFGWYRNPQQPGPSSLGIAYLEEEYKILRPDFIFFGEDDNHEIYADLIDPHGIHLSDALPKLKGLVTYVKKFSNRYRRVEAVAEVEKQLRALNLKDLGIQEAILTAESSKELFSSNLAKDYF
ncbi:MULTISPECIES: DEAD/DEAH box helicase [Acinetobacter calcoaceticus/baumannii complex]|uniref:DEAD/DEAH box helicase family protein n=1 Tax=Acinetobacter seifertii TaxID=1530123 RepID=A0A7H2PS16_9GAMM|nr:DEAD/DEAH box helicase family protein [Acinetobacter seifertii]OJU94196.1 MAG: type III restriction endonuclease subunit R [Acinetobacter sp. 38-8]QNX05649.1 DEAD/DEAH box helicase family protein [Acinetobacter seifertii]